MSKKVALVFHGQARSVDLAYTSIKEKIIDVYNPDIYCQLWWDDEIKNNGYYGHNRYYNIKGNLPDIVKELYNPKKILIDPQIIDFSQYQIFCPSKQTFLSQLIGIQRSTNLLNWSKYDFILKFRYDLEVIEFPNLNLLDDSKFYTGFNNGSHYYDDPDFFSDLAYIIPNDMKIFTEIIDNMINFGFIHTCVPEHIIQETLKKLNFRDRMVRLTSDKFYCDVIR